MAAQTFSTITIYRTETSTNQIHFLTSVIFFGRRTVITNTTTSTIKVTIRITRIWTRQLEFSKIRSMLNGQPWQWEIQSRKIRLWIATNFEILRRDWKKLSSFKCDFKFGLQAAATRAAIYCVDNCISHSQWAFTAQTCSVDAEIELFLSFVAL